MFRRITRDMRCLFRTFLKIEETLLSRNSWVALGLLAGFWTAAARAEDWPQWRGPHFNGSSAEAGLPTTWSPTQNVLWSTPLPGPSGATPVIWGDYVFVSSPDPQKNLNLICLDRRDGHVRWQKTVAFGDKTKGRNNMASPSPVTDGKLVIALYGTSDLAAYDFEGGQLWSRNLGKDYGRFSIMWIYGSSPLLYQDKVYIQVLQRNPPPNDYPTVDDKPTRESYLLCLDPRTGKTLWRQTRPSDALSESQEAYSTPIPYEAKHGTEILVVGGDCLTSHDAATGAELWRSGGFNPRKDQTYRIVTSPLAADGLIYVSGPKGQPVIAVRDGGKGDITESHRAWTFREAPTDWSTPLYYRQKLFILDGGKRVLSCLDPKTGEKKWQGSLGVPDPIWSSPTGADGKIYCVSEKGTVVVVAAGDEFNLLATIPMGEEPCRSSIAAAHGQLFIRTATTLHCVGVRN
jgi:outer membrane protein assembly factor BamB